MYEGIKIENFISEISPLRKTNPATGKETVRFLFSGDGRGDFTKRGYDASVDALVDYWAYLTKQLDFVSEIVSEKYKSTNLPEEDKEKIQKHLEQIYKETLAIFRKD